MESRKHYRDEREIDLVDLMIEVLLHWRGLIAALLIGGILLGGISCYQSYKAKRSAEAASERAQAEYQELISKSEILSEEEIADLRVQAEAAKNSLTSTQAANVEAALSIREQTQELSEYLNTSVLMRTDLNELPTGDILFYFNVPETDYKAVVAAYAGLLSSSDFYNTIAEKCGFNSEISELIDIKEYDNNNNNANYTPAIGQIDSPVLHVVCFAESIDKCNMMVDDIIKYVQEHSTGIANLVNRHEVSVISRSVGSEINIYFSDKKKNTRATYISQQADLAKRLDAFTAGEKNYYELKCRLAEGENIARKIEKPEVSIPSITVSKKKLAIGMAAGFFLYAGILFIGYIFSQKIKDSDSFADNYGVAQLGKIYGKRSFRGFGKRLDKRIYLLKNKGRKAIPEEEAETIAAANTALAAAKAEIGKLGIINIDQAGNGNSDQLIKKIEAAAAKENINCKVLSDLLCSSSETYALKDLDAVILVASAGSSRYNEIWDVLEVLDNRKVKILGGIMA